MLNAFEKLGDELGLPNVHIERFAAAEQVAPAQDSAYVAFLSRTQKSVTVPAGKSLLDALLEAGVDIDYSCREGVCGACETKVIDGTPDHRDEYLSKAEHAANKAMIVCVSGCRGQRLVLDL
jgi:vanillate O-demethylase ferredoxin subunit